MNFLGEAKTSHEIAWLLVSLSSHLPLGQQSRAARNSEL